MSQEYTPVDWVDETTSQQGTLINADRLDQMQTAHHYADGFEEVDAIPTEDPGVDYHKVVYCTADSTFYRWDGTQWTADIDEDTKHLLDQEIARAEHAEGELAQDIEDEATARQAADTTLQGNITAEATARANADTALGGRIDAETTARMAVDTSLQDDIDHETLNRQAADTALGERITAEAGSREGADTALGARIDTEKEAREDADTQLEASITAETQARVSAIAALQAGVYTKAEADNLLAAKADKATTLAGYGITDAVTLDTAQTIPGTKTFDKIILSSEEYNLTSISSTSGASEWWTVYTSREISGTYYDDVLIIVTKYRTDFGDTNRRSCGIVQLSSSLNNVGYLSWLVCGAGINPANFAAIRSNNRVLFCVKGITNINNGFKFAMVGKNDYFTVDKRVLTTEESALADAAASSSLMPLIINTPGSGAGANEAATVGYVSDTNGLNNIFHTNGNETASGIKTIESIRTNNVVRSLYYSVASGTGYSTYPWRLLYTMTDPVATNANTQITLVYGGSRPSSNAGQTPAIITIFQYGTTVRVMGIGSSTNTCIKVIKTDLGHVYVFGMCDNNNSGSGSTCFNMLTGRNESRWIEVTTERRCAITDGVAVDTDGVTVVSGTEVVPDLSA